MCRAERGDLAGDVPADRVGWLERESAAVCGDGILIAAALGEQRAACDVQLRPAGEPGAGSEGIEDRQPGRRPFGVCDGDARLASTTGDGSNRSSSLYSAAICRQSVSAAVAASAWQAAMAACS